METMIQPKIAGYRQLTEDDAIAINKIKEHGELLRKLIEELRGRGDAADQRWVSIGATDLQIGIMALVRSVAQPTSF